MQHPKSLLARTLDLCLSLIIQGYRRTEFLSAAVLILILVIEDSVFWNDLDQRKGLSCDDAAGILPSFDIRLDDDFVFAIYIEGAADGLPVFLFCMNDIYPDAGTAGTWLYDKRQVVAQLLKGSILGVTVQGSASWRCLLYTSTVNG